MYLARVPIGLLTASVLAIGATAAARAQLAASEPLKVGVIEATKRPIVETSEFIGRIEAVNRVNVVARVTAFLKKRLFEEGNEIKGGDHLYRLERGLFEADLASKQAVVAQSQATLENAKLTTDRERTLLGAPAGSQMKYDAAIANQRSLEAQVQSAQAQVQASQINLDYTDILSPIDGRIGRTAVTEGNVVGPGFGVLTTIVSQDPMYVTFPIPVREALNFRKRYAPRGGFKAVVIKIRLPDGSLFGQVGKIDFVDNAVTQNTDTFVMRGVIPNPATLDGQLRELSDGESVTVILEGVQPIEVVVIPRSAALSDQQGDYVFVVGPDNKAEQRRIQLGQSTSTEAPVISGLSPGDKLIIERLRRMRPGQPVSPALASPLIQSSMKAATTDGRTQTDGGVGGGTKPADNKP